MHRSDAIHLNFILCKYYDFITADLKVYSDRKTQRNPVRKTQRNRRSHFPNFRKITLDKTENPLVRFFVRKNQKQSKQRVLSNLWWLLCHGKIFFPVVHRRFEWLSRKLLIKILIKNRKHLEFEEIPACTSPRKDEMMDVRVEIERSICHRPNVSRIILVCCYEQRTSWLRVCAPTDYISAKLEKLNEIKFAQTCGTHIFIKFHHIAILKIFQKYHIERSLQISSGEKATAYDRGENILWSRERMKINNNMHIWWTNALINYKTHTKVWFQNSTK